MTTFNIKLIAILTMLIDHAGLFFFPHIFFLRAIGRLSFPLFSWLIANGAKHTHNIHAYLRRIFIFALISQGPFIIANRQINPSFWYLNVLFTLFLGLLAIKFIQKTEDKRIWIVVSVLCSLTAYVLKTDYGFTGVLSIIVFYLFFNKIKFLVTVQCALFIIPLVIQIVINAYHHLMVSPDVSGYLEPLALFSLIFISSYNNKQGPKSKYLFYSIYSLQYVVILLLKLRYRF